jgi:rhodanese-related sulfurtransferase
MEFSCAVVESAPALSGEEFRALLAAPPPDWCVLDVREPWEHLLTPWPAATMAIPFSELPSRLDEVPAAAETVIVCSTGASSAEAVRLLTRRRAGRVRHLRDGLRDL